jgi:hypothetical protein
MNIDGGSLGLDCAVMYNESAHRIALPNVRFNDLLGFLIVIYGIKPKLDAIRQGIDQ